MLEDFNYTSQQDPFKSTPMILLVRTLQSDKLMALLTEAIECPEFNLEHLKLGLQDGDGRTVLHYAYALGQTDLVDKLLEINKKLPKDQDITKIIDKHAKTPKELLFSLDRQAVRKILINLEMHPDRSIYAERNDLLCHYAPRLQIGGQAN